MFDALTMLLLGFLIPCYLFIFFIETLDKRSFNENFRLFFHGLIFSAFVAIFFGSCYFLLAKKDFRTEVNRHLYSAKQGNLKSQIKLAKLYSDGAKIEFFEDVGKNKQKSAYWYNKAAKQGDDESQFILGNMLEKGVGIDKNLRKAVAWYYKSAKQGNSKAQYALAKSYEKGDGVNKNFSNALLWLKKSANNNNLDAIYKLGIIYDDGLFGVSQNAELAIFWFEKIEKNKYLEQEMQSAILSRLFHLRNPPINQSQLPSYKQYNSFGQGSRPTAQCWDGSFSYSLGRQGVCSHHGGVRYWY